MAVDAGTSERVPEVGDVVRLRTRTYLVEGVDSSAAGALVRMACLDDDAQGQPLETIWGLELDREVLDEEVWKTIGKRGFDPPKLFGAYLHTLRWHCVTATNPSLFQAPFRAGIRIDAYQLEPLRKALRLPRVNLFIADDVGLGKTIEAGLITNELLLRRRVREIVVACPPAMLPQWRDELEARFGLTFEVLDRQYVERIREERGYGVNPWTTFPRFLVSHRLLIDESYAAPLRDWLDNLRPGTLLILDEAHHAAPSSGSRYAIDSKITRAIRDLAPRFEHRLFLSATPHNGHSNSFSALLEILDSQRFCRGVKVLKSHLDHVMVRRLKDDVRAIAGGFPERRVKQVDIVGLPDDAPELLLARLLDQYRDVRQRRVEGASKRKQAEAALLVSGLQQRLLSSIEAFSRTLRVHRRTMEKVWSRETAIVEAVQGSSPFQLELLAGAVDADDERAELSEEELQALEDAQIAASTQLTVGDDRQADSEAERRLLSQMESVAEQARAIPDARVRYLIEWIRQHMCPGVRLPGQRSPQPGAPWNDLRLLIFTEYEDTRRYLVNMLRAAIAGTELDEHRVEVFHGPTPPDKRDQIKRAFNKPPQEHPVRILVATDAAREGLNLQAHCWNLFHFDLPWNPSRLEQRNGRIDRKLQSAPIVYCYYFVYTQRPEDRVLEALVRKTKTIREELGSLAQVLESRLAATLRAGIRHADAVRIADEIDSAGLDPEKQATTEEELEVTRQRQDELREQVEQLERRVEDARKWIGLDTEALQDALSCSLELLDAEPLAAGPPPPPDEPPRFVFPNLDDRVGGDPTWATTLDTLRPPPEDGRRNFQWRREARVRPVVFQAPKSIDDSVVQLHLQHRVVQRLLSRFVAQGFVHHDLSRACLAQSEDNIPRVALIGRLSMYGAGAVRLHEEMLTVTARWVEPERRGDGLKPYAREAEARTLEMLEQSLRPGLSGAPPEAVASRLLAAIGVDVEQLLPHLQERGEAARKAAEAALEQRGQTEAAEMRRILEDQKKRILAELGKSVDHQLKLFDTDDERRQYESNRRYWQRWIENVEGDLRREPDRILDFYRTSSYRIEPVGIAYLYPVRA
ncbi:MAG: DISARM system SNF2-like helicase DrmD [Thermoguttaceae bacterium]|nr:DISARM system SNF2-like helicase DrmD [Thermoguttaceae bacterium]